MRKVTATLLAAAVCAAALAAPVAAAPAKKAGAKKCSGEFMYVDKKTKKCMDARQKKG